MVCKDDVLLWFRGLESYNRIDVMYGLLSMCVPAELRFLGSCIEDAGKTSYEELRGHELDANDLEKLSKEFTPHSVLDKCVRHRAILTLSLLSSRNCSVANWLYKSVIRTDILEDLLERRSIDETVRSELLLLFVLTRYHPAFTFQQRLSCSKLFMQLTGGKDLKSRESPKPYAYSYPPPGFGFSNKSNLNTAEVPTLPTGPQLKGVTTEDPRQLDLLPPPILSQPQELITWHYPGIICGAPEAPPFPIPTMSTLVNDVSSPNHSRSTSPHRTVIPKRLTAMVAPMESVPNTHVLNQPLSDVKKNEEEKNVGEDTSWKAHNGYRMGVSGPPMVSEQFGALNLEDDGSLKRSNSSSNSSLNQTPPETPGASTLPKPQINGVHFGGTSLALCDTTTSPNSLFNNGSMTFPNYAPFTGVPRSVFSYSQNFRPPFTHFSTNDSTFSTYSVPYVVYPPYSHRTQNCYNCGGLGHLGSDCNGQTIEDITQKHCYTLDFSSTALPESDK